jgi:hypothetical protein
MLRGMTKSIGGRGRRARRAAGTNAKFFFCLKFQQFARHGSNIVPEQGPAPQFKNIPRRRIN